MGTRNQRIMFAIMAIIFYCAGFVTGIFQLPPYRQLVKIKRYIYPSGSTCTSIPSFAMPVAYKERVSRDRIDSNALVFLILGQSNAANHGQEIYKPCPKVFEIYGSECFYAQDPLFGASGYKGSIWTRMADQLVISHGVKSVVLASAAIGSSSVRCWAENFEYINHVRDIIMNVQAKGFKISFVLWQQGETDAGQMYRDEYLRHLKKVVTNLRDMGVHAPVFIARASSYRKPDSGIIEAQNQMHNSANMIFLGPETDMTCPQKLYHLLC